MCTVGVLTFLVKSFSAEKENGPVLYPYLKDIRLLALDNLALLALVASVPDNDLIAYLEVCHTNLPGANYL